MSANDIRRWQCTPIELRLDVVDLLSPVYCFSPWLLNQFFATFVVLPEPPHFGDREVDSASNANPLVREIRSHLINNVTENSYGMGARMGALYEGLLVRTIIVRAIERSQR